MAKLQRRSPVALPGEAQSVRQDHGWTVVTEYVGESAGPWLVDASHVNKWDIQARNLDRLDSEALRVPSAPGECRWQGGRLTMRLNPSQAAAWDLSGQGLPHPEGPELTDVSEASALLAVLGQESYSILEKLSDLDLGRPGLPSLKLWQAPVCGVPCRVVRLLDPHGGVGVVLGFSRGYAASMTMALLEAGREFGLAPGGEGRLTEVCATLG